MTPIWDSKLGQIIVARLVFGFVTRRIWFTRAEVKHSFSKHHDIAQLSDLCLLVLRQGPSARPQGVVIVAHEAKCRFGCRESDFALQGLVECRALET